jgi:ATP-binding cassette subfamily C protein CydD
MDETKTAARAWLRGQTRLARRGSWPVVLCGLGFALAGIAGAACAAWALTDGLVEHEVAPWLLAGFAFASLLQAGLGVLSDRFAFDAGAGARRRLRSDALGRLLAAGPAVLRASHSGTLASIVVDRIEGVDGLFARWLPSATLALAGPVLVAAAALCVDPMAALLLGLAGLMVPVAMAISGLGAAAASRRQFAALAHLQARFLDRISGIATIVLAGRTEAEAIGLGKAADELRRRTMRVLRVAFLSSTALDLAGAVALILLALRYAAMLRLATLASPGTALFCLLLVPQFFAPLRNFAAAYQDRMHAIGAAEALTTLPPPPPPAPALEVRTVEAHGVTIALEHVSLSWDTSRGKALDDVSFRVAPGETLILAGPSGSGKSTIIEILLGFVRPDEGRVTFNGADSTTLVPAALSRLIAWIGQRPVLFAGTLRDNIRFARPEATDAEVEDAAQFARVDSFAAGLPQGLDTEVGEGGYGLSGGQAQRVAIARAFLRNAPILLLDEPTSHLDPVTEAEVLDSLRRLALGRTVVLASHATAAHNFGGRRLDLRHGRIAAARGAA